jgi:thioester reductase-like protein
VRGDITAARLGLGPVEYASLLRRVDAVVHCAAVTEFNRTDGSLEETNIAGTGRVLELCEAADVPLYHVSSAYRDARADGPRGEVSVRYAASKRAGEDLVRHSGLPAVILRPSVVIGDSRSGAISAFQGLHRVAAAVLDGLVPMLPFDPSWRIDFVPSDVVAQAIAAVVAAEATTGEFWISAGAQALTLREALDVTLEVAAAIGSQVQSPRFVPPDLFDRLIAPVFLDALPAKVRATVLRMLEFFTAYLSGTATLPSDLDALVRLGGAPLPDQRESLATSLRWWAQVTGRWEQDAEVVA